MSSKGLIDSKFYKNQNEKNNFMTDFDPDQIFERLFIKIFRKLFD